MLLAAVLALGLELVGEAWRAPVEAVEAVQEQEDRIQEVGADILDECAD